MWNHTPAFVFLQRLPGFLTFRWSQELDAVSGASRNLGLRKVGRLGDNEKALDGISGASRREFRHSEQATVAYANQGREASGSLYFSDENDYTSLSPSVSAAWTSTIATPPCPAPGPCSSTTSIPWAASRATAAIAASRP